MRKRTGLVLLLALGLAGCDLAKSSRDGIASAKGALDKAKLEYSCGTPSEGAVCGKIRQAVAVKDVAIDALSIYCSGPSFEAGGACNGPAKGTSAAQQAADKLNAAMRQLNQIMADLKPLLKGGK